MVNLEELTEIIIFVLAR